MPWVSFCIKNNLYDILNCLINIKLCKCIDMPTNPTKKLVIGKEYLSERLRLDISIQPFVYLFKICKIKVI